jgi:hypothetical protein
MPNQLKPDLFLRRRPTSSKRRWQKEANPSERTSVALSPRKPVKHLHDWQGIAVVVEIPSTAKPGRHHAGFPPENADAPVVGGVQDEAIDFFKEFSLAFGGLGEWPGFLLVLGGAPAIRDFDQHDILMIGSLKICSAGFACPLSLNPVPFFSACFRNDRSAPMA